MNEISKKQTALDILGIDQEKVKQIHSPEIKAQAEARNGFPIRSLLTSEIKTFLTDQIVMACDNLGQKNVSQEIQTSILTGLPQILNTSYFNWTREEMAQAWQMGSLGKLGGGEIHVSARTLIQWLDQYNEQHKKPAYRKLKRISASNSSSGINTPKTEEMTREAKLLALNEALALHNAKELLAYTPIFKLLWNLEYLNKENVRTWELVGKANAAILFECKEMSGSKLARDEARQRKEAIKKVREGELNSIPEFVKARMKQIAVTDFFDSLEEDFKF